MGRINEDRYWMQVQARYEHWDEDDVEDDFFEDDEGYLDEVDLEVDERLLARNR